MSSTSTHPSISFNPALSLQRQAFLLQELRKVKPKSILDIGCGEGLLLECLVRCDEALPIELLAGIDASIARLQRASRAIEAAANDQQAEGRWRSLDISLLEGKFTQVEFPCGVFEAIISSEVIEHLDPPDLGEFWEIHLQTLKPNTLIVTTPNRDFNVLFERVEELSNRVGRSYTREGVPYRLRHEDHRFEYTRAEFEEASRTAANKFAYDVSFSGVGTPQNAFSQHPELLEQFSDFPNVGFCTQIAVFTRPSPRTVTFSQAINWGSLAVVSHFHYPCNVFTKFPPDPEVVALSLGGMWRQFRPHATSQYRSSRNSSPAVKVYGAKYYELDNMVCEVDTSKLWDLNYSLQKLCRFDKCVFMKAGQTLEGRTFDREFVGMEVDCASMRSFRFAYSGGEMHIVYEFEWGHPEIDPLHLSDVFV